MNNDIDKDTKILGYDSILTGKMVVQPPRQPHVIFDGKTTKVQQPMAYKSLHLMELAGHLEMESKKNVVDKETIAHPG
ncbi:uncharacterized protein SCHCODRAFT_01105774 [Schizophyllum commune H4-8]|nr:uncharacterized protein SCHCODRAFT_01105774 [Schizophyllum commune H4-8]KAI5887181.1 hypothetical protein SCHCODRAFT_01105774 [Schizophyllum commune H4-8]